MAYVFRITGNHPVNLFALNIDNQKPFDHYAMNEEYKITRRKVLGGLGIGLATVAVSPTIAAPTEQTNNTNPHQGLEDPTTKYPKPPFKSQSQPWPGLSRDMDPKPDHGEKSYKGSGRLAGRKALIT